MKMRRIGWGWLLCLALSPNPGLLPESAVQAVEELEESDRHADREAARSLRRKTVRRTFAAPSISARPRPIAPESLPEPVGLWISRTHQRSPTA